MTGNMDLSLQSWLVIFVDGMGCYLYSMLVTDIIVYFVVEHDSIIWLTMQTSSFPSYLKERSDGHKSQSLQRKKGLWFSFRQMAFLRFSSVNTLCWKWTNNEHRPNNKPVCYFCSLLRGQICVLQHLAYSAIYSAWFQHLSANHTEAYAFKLCDYITISYEYGLESRRHIICLCVVVFMWKSELHHSICMAMQLCVKKAIWDYIEKAKEK